MSSPQDRDREVQQSQSTPDLCDKYRTIGIQAVSAATLFKRPDAGKTVRRQPVFADRDDA